MSDLGASMSGMGITPDLSRPVSFGSNPVGIGTRLTGGIQGMSQAVNSLLSGLTKVHSVVSKILQDSAGISRNFKSGTFAMSGGGFNNGNVGSSSGFSLGTAPVSAVTQTGQLMGGSGSSLGLGTFGGSKVFNGLLIAGGVGGMARGGLQMGLAGAGAVYASLPATQDVLTANRLSFNASLASGRISASGMGRWSSQYSLGLGTNNLDALQAANVLGSYGYGAGSSYGTSALRQSAGLSLLTGQSMQSVAGILGSQLTNPYMSNQLRMLGMSTRDYRGNPVGFNSMADQMYKTFGFSGLNPEQLSREFQPGMNGARNLEFYVQDPQMRAMIQQYMMARAQNGGKSIDLGSSNIKSTLGGISGGVLGAETSMRGLETSEADKINAYAKAMSDGIKTSADAVKTLNDKISGAAGLLESVASAKSAFDTFAGSKTGGGVMGAASQAVSGFSSVVQGAIGAVAGVVGMSGAGALMGKAGGALSATTKIGGRAAGPVGVALAVGDTVLNAGDRYQKGKDMINTGNFDFWNIDSYNVATIAGMVSAHNQRSQAIGPIATNGVKTVLGGGAGGSVGAQPGAGSNGTALTDYASSFVGTPYVWGGTSEKGWDCSGFVQYVFKKYGVNLPRTSQEQYRVGTPVQYADAQPGDLLFFHYAGGQAGANHVGIYVGNGKMVQAANARKGTITSGVDTKNLIGVRRVLQGAVGQGAKPAVGGNSNSLNSVGTSALTALSLTNLGVSGSGISAQIGSLNDLLQSAGVGMTPGVHSVNSSSGSTGGAASAPGDNSLTGILRQAGFSGSNLQMAYAIAMAESGGKASAVGKNKGSTDRGLFQINDKWHPEVSQSQIFDPLYNAQQAFRISGGGTNWKPWSTFINGSYKKYLSSAPGYSEGAWNISQDHPANVHQGEMILPASVARSVRENVQKQMSGNVGGVQGGVTIQVFLQNATDAEAVRFAQRVQSVLAGKAELAMIGSN